MSQSDIQHRQLRLLLQQKSCLCCYCCYYISVVFQNPQAKNSSKNLKWQPAFRLVKVVFVVVNRQHRVHNQTVVPVVSVVVKTKAQKRSLCCRLKKYEDVLSSAFSERILKKHSAHTQFKEIILSLHRQTSSMRWQCHITKRNTDTTTPSFRQVHHTGRKRMRRDDD